MATSLLADWIERIRFYADEPSVDARWTDDRMLKHIITPSVGEVWNRINSGHDRQILIRHDITLSSQTRYYILPPHMRQVRRLVLTDSSGNPIYDVIPYSLYSPGGFRWRINGNALEIDIAEGTTDTATETAQIWYVPNSTYSLHQATDGEIATSTTFVLSASPSLGTLEDAPNAYAGAIIRIYGGGNSEFVEERIVDSYDRSTRTATVGTAFENSANTGVYYEIIPPTSEALSDCICKFAALQLSIARKAGQAQQRSLNASFASALKTIRDEVSAFEVRSGMDHITAGTVDNPDTHWYLRYDYAS